jgi:hypothetical protein
MHFRNFRRLIILFISITTSFVANLHSQTVKYDKPINKIVIDYGQSIYRPNYPSMHSKLSCFYYKSYLIKQLDEQEKGAEWISIVPLHGEIKPRCSKVKAKEEFRFNDDGHPTWEGYFGGVLKDYLFLDSADGMNGAMYFGIFDLRSGKQLFKDDYQYAFLQSNGKYTWHDDRKMHWNSNGELVISYIHAHFASCSLIKEKINCWKQVQVVTGLQSVMPNCSGYTNDNPDDPSVIFYPIESIIKVKPETHPLPGSVRCEATG